MKTRNLHIGLLVLYMMQVVGLVIAIGVVAVDHSVRLYWVNETFTVFDTTWNPVYLLIPYLGIPVIFHLGFLLAQRWDYIRLGDLSTPEVSWTHFVRWLEIGVANVFALTFIQQVSGTADMWTLVHVSAEVLSVHVVGYLSEFERRPRIYVGAAIPAVAILVSICLAVFYDKTAHELWVMAIVILIQSVSTVTLHTAEIYERISYRNLEQIILILNFCSRTIVVWEGFNFVLTHG